MPIKVKRNGAWVEVYGSKGDKGDTGVVFYESLAQAVADINNGVNDNAIQDSSIAKVKVFTADNGALTVMLLDDISESAQIDINKDIDLVLNGKTLTFTDNTAYLNFGVDTSCKIDGTVDGSTINKTFSATSSTPVNVSYYIIKSGGKNFVINGGSYSASGLFWGTYFMVVRTNGSEANVLIENCSISVLNTDTTAMSNIFGVMVDNNVDNVTIKNSKINLDSANGKVFGVMADKYVEIYNSNVSVVTRPKSTNSCAYGIDAKESIKVKDSKIHADAQGCQAVNNKPLSIGIFDDSNKPKTILLENTDVTGTHCGVQNSGEAQLYVNGGTLTGFSHGGIYTIGDTYVRDAILRCGNYDGIFDYTSEENFTSGYINKPLANLYVAGTGTNVYLDGCTLNSEEATWSFVAKGDANNTINISNSTVVEGTEKIRLDSDTHRINVGVGTNLTSSMFSDASLVNFTNDVYRKLHEDEICDGSDYDALVKLNLNGTYYTTLSQAISDVNNGINTNSTTDKSTAKVKVFTAEDGLLTVKLLDNISESTVIDINKDINLVLNGKTLEFTGNNSYLSFNTGTSCNINGEIDGSKIIKNIENLTANSTVQAILGNGEKLTVKGGSYFIIGNVSHILMTFKVGGTNSLFELDNCIVKATNTDEVLRAGICSARAIQSMAIKTIIKNSDIQSDAINECDAIKSVNFIVDNCVVNAITRNTKQDTAAFSIVNHGNSIIKNSKIHSDAPFDGRGVNLSKSMGIDNEETGTLLIEDTDVTASYYAVYLKSNSKTYVKGGIFTGYSCGGFYFGQGQNSETYIKDAVIRCGNYDGIFDYSGNVTSESGYKVSPFTSFQVNYNYGKIYLDGCMIGEPGYTSFLINGQNNEVNISNSTIVNGAKPITIYGNTNKLNIGINTNITTSIITAPSYANFTDKLYRKLHKNEICGGNDFNTFVNFLNSQVNKTIVSDDGNGNVIVSGLSTASVGQGG